MPKPLSMQAFESDELKFLRIEDRAKELMDLHGLTEQGWKFQLSTSQRRLGVCKYSRKLIEFSTYFEHIEWEEIEDTILHEIAHALVGSDHGHDWVWKAKCIEIGAKPTRLADHTVKSAAKPNFVVECTACGKRWKRYRLRRSLLREDVRSSCCKAPIKAYKVVKK